MAGGGVFIEDTTLLDLVDEDRTPVSGTDEAEIGKLRKHTARNAADRAEEGKAYGAPRRFGWLGASRVPTGRVNLPSSPQRQCGLVVTFSLVISGVGASTASTRSATRS